MELEPKIKDLLWELYKETQTTHLVQESKPIKVYFSSKEIPQIN